MVYAMIDAGVKGIYAPGGTIHAKLCIRWSGTFDEVAVTFLRLYSPFGGAFGNRIDLRGRYQEWVTEEESQPYTRVELEGEVPYEARTGTYVCAFVRCFVPGRGWETLFEKIPQLTLSVRREAPPIPPRSKEGAEFLGIEFCELPY
jgi:hypothetical protein